MGETWRPSCDFEDEMMSIQPDCDLIFPEHGKNPDSLAGPEIQNEFLKLFREGGHQYEMPLEKSKELHIIGKIRQMIPGKKLVGRRLTEEDLDNDADREAETIAMIRDCGSAPSVDVNLASKHTLPTILSKQSYRISNGQPVLFDPEYFKLKPRSSSSENSISKSSDVSTSSSSDAIHKTFTIKEIDGLPSKVKCKFDQRTLNGKSLSIPCVPDGNISIAKGKHLQINEENTNNKLFKGKFITPKELYMQKRDKS